MHVLINLNPFHLQFDLQKNKIKQICYSNMNTNEETNNTNKMHELFMQVLKNRDLSRAGDLFSVPDSVIVNDLTQVVCNLKFIVVYLFDYQLKNCFS